MKKLWYFILIAHYIFAIYGIFYIKDFILDKNVLNSFISAILICSNFIILLTHTTIYFALTDSSKNTLFNTGENVKLKLSEIIQTNKVKNNRVLQFKECMTKHGYENLCDKIKVTNDNKIADGNHRYRALLDLYGSDLYITVIKYDISRSRFIKNHIFIFLYFLFIVILLYVFF